MRTGFVVILTMIATAWVATPASAQHMVAFIDSQRILAQAPGAEEVRTAIQKERENFNTQMQMLQDSVTKLLQQFQARSLTMTEAAKQAEQARIAAIDRELNATAQRLQLEVEQKQQELMKPIVDKVDAAVEAVRRDGGFAIIFDLTRTGIAAADPTLDITPQVIARLNASASGGGTTEPTKPGGGR